MNYACVYIGFEAALGEGRVAGPGPADAAPPGGFQAH